MTDSWTGPSPSPPIPQCWLEWCLATLSFAAAACTQRIKIMTRWMDCYARETAIASRMRRYISKCMSKYMPRYMSKLQFAPVFDIHRSPLSLSLRCILRCLPACFAARSFVCTVFVCMYMPCPTNAALHRSIATLSTPMLSPVCPLNSCCNSASNRLFCRCCCSCYRVFALVRALLLLAGCTSQGTTCPIASLRTVIGVLANSLEQSALQLLQHELGASKGDERGTGRPPPAPNGLQDSSRPVHAGRFLRCCQCGE